MAYELCLDGQLGIFSGEGKMPWSACMKEGNFAWVHPVAELGGATLWNLWLLDFFSYFLHSNTAPVVRRSNTGNSARYVLITREKDPLYDSHIVGVKYLKKVQETLWNVVVSVKRSHYLGILSASPALQASAAAVFWKLRATHVRHSDTLAWW